MSFEKIGNPEFIVLQTFRKSGEAVSTPVWVVANEGSLYVLTQRTTGKAKRIRNNPKIKISVGDRRGMPKSDWLEGRARILETREDLQRGLALLEAKYGIPYKIANFLRALRRANDAAVIVEIKPVKGGAV